MNENNRSESENTMHIIKRREQRMRDMFLAEWFIGGFIVGVLMGLWLWA